MHSGIALDQGTQCLFQGRRSKYKECTVHSGNSLYKGPLPIMHGGSATYHGKIRIIDYESAPYRRARCIVNGGTT